MTTAVPTSSEAFQKEISFRDAAGEDTDFVFKLFATTREAELSLVPWTAEQKSAFLQMQFDAQSKHYSNAFPDMDQKIVLIDGDRAGRIMTVELPGDLHVIDISILPAYRNLGIGTMLLRNLMSEADRGHVVLSLYVEVYNRARTLYERLGFVEVSTDKIYARMEYRPGQASANDVQQNSLSQRNRGEA